MAFILKTKGTIQKLMIDDRQCGFQYSRAPTTKKLNPRGKETMK